MTRETGHNTATSSEYLTEDRRAAAVTEEEGKLSDDYVSIAPFDEHNRRLLSQVHPPDWINPEPAGRYNLVVIGAGTAGLVTAAGAAALGGKVALVERALLGGDCLNVGCVPSKALLRCSRVYAEVRAAKQYGIDVSGEVSVDFPAVMERMRRLRASISPHDSASRFRAMGIDVFLGAARFTGPDTIEVNGSALRFSRACIATGARAAHLPIPGLADAGYLTNETIFSLTSLPQRLAVIGGGPIGCEMSQAFARFGAHVTLLEAGAHILMREDADAAQLIADSLRRDGVDIRCSAKVTQVQCDNNGKILMLEEGDAVLADAILVAVGRQPNVDGLGLERAGVAFDLRKGVLVNDRLQTTNRRIYAAGDVCSPYKFTHAADAAARLVIQNALFFGRARFSAVTIPWCTYTDPEIAHVGLNVRDAERSGIPIDTYRIDLSQVDRAILDGQDRGFLKVHVKRGKDAILGATLVAAHAGDMIAQITQAMEHNIGLSRLARTVHPYPTQAEIIRKAGDAYNRTRLTPTIVRLFETLMRWRR